jgi:hypothetical protein
MLQESGILMFLTLILAVDLPSLIFDLFPQT